MEKGPTYTRPKDLVKTLFGVDYKGLSEEERAMQKLLVEEYKKHQKNLLDEVRRWRDGHPEATLNDSIRALYKELEEEG